ncbi:histidine kinase [Nonomuraea sp. NPDC003804]|uniref:sensor histidine kinase n=1 Tax=Nonomuraea sp. NPDC003804 TaxID=3154547 RepID=UPI0033B662B7
MRVGRAIWRFFGRPEVFDATLVIVLGTIAVVGLVAGLVGDPPLVAGGAMLLASALPLLARRRHPIPVAVAVAGLDVVGTLTGTNSVATTALIALYSLGRYTEGRRTLVTAVALATAYGIALAVRTPTESLAIASYLVAVGVGQLVRARVELRERSARERADEAVRAERRRIARELHDVVAHHLSVINALVGGARAVMPPDPPEAREALLWAEQTARQALTEMRHLLDVLRADGPGGGEATGAGAAGLPALVEQAGAAGLPASLAVDGTPVPLPAAIDLAVYRIVQEALTNTRKHTRGARATVRISYEERAVEVEVLDDGTAGPSSSPGGFGLAGMAERVALCGGQLFTGPREVGGFEVRARLPL